MKKAKLKILSLLTVATVISSISLNTISALATGNDVAIQSEEKVLSTLNLALGKTAVASSVEPEGENFTADKITDGDRTSRSSRWSSGHFTNGHQPWIYVDLGEETEFDKIKLYWETANAKVYRIEVSNDAENWSKIHRKDNAQGGEELISFEEKQNARYVRLFCEENNPDVWTTVSLYEMEIYNGELPTNPQEVIDNLVVPIINKGDTKLQMPKVPSDMEIEFIGCDYQEIIASDLTINEPLVDTKVTVDFRVKQGETSLETKGIEVTVPGKYSGNIGANTKPEVIPSLREWVGKDGNFQIADSSRIVLDGNYEAELSKTAEIFKEDYKDILGKDIEIIT
ncbi:discoidin domain-containing protein, partial [Clostridium tarantellae]